MTDTNRIPLYRTIWRWHFYAALFVIPFILVLSATGAAYSSSGGTCRPASQPPSTAITWPVT